MAPISSISRNKVKMVVEQTDGLIYKSLSLINSGSEPYLALDVGLKTEYDYSTYNFADSKHYSLKTQQVDILAKCRIRFSMVKTEQPDPDTLRMKIFPEKNSIFQLVE